MYLELFVLYYEQMTANKNYLHLNEVYTGKVLETTATTELQKIFSFLGTWDTGKKLSAR